ncbi:1384_t:CDS:10 [Paraglomus brasilianum]|uniref:1384_t:CDS:1 n=1 Tax=Paraglomus brasilianum TaxID=144538 RepID=A0A9N9CV72_9GLOM|nr:1384_t:CDS:10 [Paraglomus brasilianum]
MEFSDFYKHSSYLTKFSPDGLYIATVYQNRLAVRDSITLKVLNVNQSDAAIEHVNWSPDSHFFLAASYTAGTVYIGCIGENSWSAVIEEGTAGLKHARWTPDGRGIMCFSDFRLRLTIWSLATGDVCYMQNPKYNDKGYSFRKDGRYFALTERREGKDFIGIYDCENMWNLVRHFVVDTVDLDNIAWSPDGRVIAVWDNCIQYKVLIYTPDGRCQKSYCAYEMGLGVKTATWSPSSQFLAVGSYDQRLRFLGNYTWEPVIEFYHAGAVNVEGLTILREDVEMPAREYEKPVVTYIKEEQPYELPVNRVGPEKGQPRLGVGTCKFNANGTLLASRNGKSPVKQFLWNPIDPDQLAICSGSNTLCFWSAHEMDVCHVEVPNTTFSVNNIRWRPDGKSLLIMDKNMFSTANFQCEEDEAGEQDLVSNIHSSSSSSNIK